MEKESTIVSEQAKAVVSDVANPSSGVASPAQSKIRTIVSLGSEEWPESYVKNCLVRQRGGDDVTFFHTDTQDGHVLAMLNGYAIIPIEEYFGLINEPVPERIAQALG